MDFYAQQILTIAFDESGDIVIELLHACLEVRPEKLTLLTFRFRHAMRNITNPWRPGKLSAACRS